MIDEKTTQTTRETSTAVVVADRRRPGRTAVDPALIPLLRGEQPPTEEPDFVGDDMAGLRGIAWGVLLSIPIWIAIARLGTWLFAR